MNNSIYRSFAKWWLTCLLFFMIFDNMIIKSVAMWSKKVAASLGHLDELTIAVFSLLAIIEFYKNRQKLDWMYFIILFPLIALGILGLISGTINGNPMKITVLGVVDYIKSFSFIFIYAAFFTEFSDFKKIFRLLMAVTIFLAAVAFIQEVWALVQRYVFDKDIHDKSIYLLYDLPLSFYRVLLTDHWRMGIFRAPSLIRNPNVLGSVCMFVFVMYLSVKEKTNILIILSLLIGGVTSVSRRALIGFIMVIPVRIFKRRKWLAALSVLAIVTVVGLFYMGVVTDNQLLEFVTDKSAPDRIAFRDYMSTKSMEIWKDHPVWGVGPGMYGGVISLKYNSYLYQEYNLAVVMSKLKEWQSAHLFWLAVMAEMGILSAGIFAGLLISLYAIFYILSQRPASHEMRGLYSGLALFTVIIVVNILGGDMKNFVVVIYTIFAGIGLGCKDSNGS